MGYKLWTTNELLTSADVNAYLMKQSVIVCTSGTHPSSPPEGMLIYETDTDRYSSWTGSAWTVLGQTVTGTSVPTLTGSGGNPNLGTTGTVEGRYTIFCGKWCTFRGSIQWGGTGVTSGSGQYLIALPFTASSAITNGVSNVGQIMLRDDSASPILRTGACYIAAGSTTFAMFEATTGGVTSTVPWTWGSVGAYISWTITYEIT